MSMINRMLSDLERRGAPKPKSGDAELVPDRSPPASRRPALRRLFPVLLAGILIVVAIALWVERGNRLRALWQSVAATDAGAETSDKQGGNVADAATEANEGTAPQKTVESFTGANEPDSGDAEAGKGTAEAETPAASPSGTAARTEDHGGVKAVAESDAKPEPVAAAESRSEPEPETKSEPESQSTVTAGAGSATGEGGGSGDAAVGTADAVPYSSENEETAEQGDATSEPTVGELQENVQTAVASEGGRVHKSMSLSPEARARRRYREGRQALESGHLGKARRLLDDALALDPSLHPARDLLVSLMRRAGQHDTARRLLDEGIERAPGRVEYAMPYARLLVDTGELERAANVLARARASGGNNAGFHALAAAVAQRRGLHDQAARAYTRALEIDPDNGIWWLGLGISLAATERPQEARTAFREARASGDLGDDLDRWAGRRIEELGGEG